MDLLALHFSLSGGFFLIGSSHIIVLKLTSSIKVAKIIWSTILRLQISKKYYTWGILKKFKRILFRGKAFKKMHENPGWFDETTPIVLLNKSYEYLRKKGLEIYYDF
jgi:hypothetical protein